MTVGAKPDVELQMAAAAMRMMQAQSEWNQVRLLPPDTPACPLTASVGRTILVQ